MFKSGEEEEQERLAVRAACAAQLQHSARVLPQVVAYCKRFYLSVVFVWFPGGSGSHRGFRPVVVVFAYKRLTTNVRLTSPL